MEEIVNELDNWTLIKVLGGLGAVLTLILVFAGKIIIHRILHGWQGKRDKHIEELKGDIIKNNSVISNLTENIGHNFQKLQEKRIQAVEIYWRGIVDMRSIIPPPIAVCYNIFQDTELNNENLNKTRSKLGDQIETIPENEFFGKLHNYSVGIKFYRPFLSEKLWTLLYAYQGFIGRSSFLLIDGYNKNNITPWKEDEGIKELLRIVLNQKEFEFIVDLGPHSYEAVFDILETKMVNEANRMISSEELSNNSMEVVEKMIKLQKSKNQGGTTID